MPSVVGMGCRALHGAVTLRGDTSRPRCLPTACGPRQPRLEQSFSDPFSFSVQWALPELTHWSLPLSFQSSF